MDAPISSIFVMKEIEKKMFLHDYIMSPTSIKYMITNTYNVSWKFINFLHIEPKYHENAKLKTFLKWISTHPHSLKLQLSNEYHSYTTRIIKNNNKKIYISMPYLHSAIENI